MSNPTQFVSVNAIPYGTQTIDEDEIAAAIEVLRSSTLTQGPSIASFEQAVAQYCQVDYAVSFSSGTAALHAACAAAGLGPGDEAIMPPITFVATSNAVLYQRATPVFADIDPASWNMDISQSAGRITPSTKALMPVHFAGLPADLTAFYRLADQHRLVVIEDACHALGATYRGKPIGHCRDMAVFSFHPVKSITTGEGGMVVTPHRHFYDKLLHFRSHGITRMMESFRYLEQEPWAYEMQSLGYNYRMTDIQAAIGKVQMGRLPQFMARRQQIRDRYVEAFQEIPAIQLQKETVAGQSSNHLFVVRLDPNQTTVTRRQLYDTLLKANIRAQVHYIPVHLQPYYREQLHTKPGDFPHSEAYYAHCLSLPIFPKLTQGEQDYVIRIVKAALA